MNIRQLLENINQGLIRGTIDPEAEVIISAPMSSSRNPHDQGRKDELIIPVLLLQPGKFPANGKPWLMIQGTDVWDRDSGVKFPDAPDSEITPVFQLVEDHELEEVPDEPTA